VQSGVENNLQEELSMTIEIRKLSPSLAEAYAHFFDVTPHDVNIDERKCYCVSWRSDDSYSSDDRHWFATREERRARAVQFVKDGSLQGYLAYYGDEVVGWCNATAECQGGVNHLREYWPIEEYRENIKVKSIFCFVIAPEFQRKGIATQLVERVCIDAEAEGYDFVEAYVNTSSSDDPHEYRGHLTMYERCGFIKQAEKDGRAVVRKALI
jgi:GNAT superfamily N-acetyltransferase